MANKRTIVYLPKRLTDFVEHDAKFHGVSVSEIVRRLLENNLNEREKTPGKWARK